MTEIDKQMSILGGLIGGLVVVAAAAVIYQLRGAGPRRRRHVARDIRNLERNAR